MDFHERMGIGHELHTFWNPVSEESVDELIESLPLDPDPRVLDIACGPAAYLTRIVARYGGSGIGVDVSPRALASARAAVAQHAPGRIEIVDAEGAAFAEQTTEHFDLVCLVGASWIWKGYEGTLQALKRLVKPGGLILFGEPYWKVENPPTAFCEIEGVQPDSFTTLVGLQDAAQAQGLRLIYLRRSSDAEWDRYEMLQSLATDRWVRAHPDHPDRDELLAMQDRQRANYLRYGFDVFGFAQMVLRAQ